MNVRELIDLLSNFDLDGDVAIYDETNDFPLEPVPVEIQPDADGWVTLPFAASDGGPIKVRSGRPMTLLQTASQTGDMAFHDATAISLMIIRGALDGEES